MAKQFQFDTGGTLPIGLLSYFKMLDGNDYYGSNNLVPAGNTTFVTGKVGNAAEFDGTDDYLDGGDVLGFSRTSPFSLACWIEPDVTNSSRIIVSKKDFDADGAGYVWYCISGGKLRFIIDGPGGAQRILVQTTNAVLSDNTYVHVVLTYSGSSTAAGVTMYVNGSSVALTTSTDNLASADTTNAISFNVGGANDGASGADFDGEIDELGVWSKALSSTEVTDLYNGGSGQTMVNDATQMLSETPTITDTIHKTTQRSLSQTITAADTIIRSVLRTLSESHTIGNVFTSLKVITASMTLETVTVTQGFLRSIARTLSESPAITDVLAKLSSRVLTQTISTADTLLKQAGKLLADAVATTDTILRAIGRTASESLALGETLLKATARTVLDALSLGNVFTRGLVYGRTFIESFSVTDRIAKYLNGLLSRYSSKYPAQGTSYSSKYPARGTSYEEKYPT